MCCLVSCALIVSSIALTIWFWVCLLIVLLWPPPKFTWGIIHEALDHM